jgi:integrase
VRQRRPATEGSEFDWLVEQSRYRDRKIHLLIIVASKGIILKHPIPGTLNYGGFIHMNPSQQKRFNLLYQSHVKALKRQGKAKATIDAYARAVRRIAEYFDRCPDKLSAANLKDYFSSLVQSHSWSTVKLDRNGLQFFYKHTLNKQWD